MNTSESDEELGRKMRELATELRYSPEALLALAKETVEWQSKSVLPNVAPFPKLLAEEEITPAHLEQWPEWTAPLIRAGCNMELLHWPDGTTTVRLMSPRGRVLAAAIEKEN